MERESAWKRYDEDQLAELEQLAAGYIDFISENKTEREFSAAAIRSAEAAGYESLDAAISAGRKLVPGDKVWATMRNKAVILVQLGARPLTDGMNILGAHIDSPRLDVKQNPLYESSELASWTLTTTAASSTTNGSPSRWRCTASSPKRTAAWWT